MIYTISTFDGSTFKNNLLQYTNVIQIAVRGPRKSRASKKNDVIYNNSHPLYRDGGDSCHEDVLSTVASNIRFKAQPGNACCARGSILCNQQEQF